MTSVPNKLKWDEFYRNFFRGWDRRSNAPSTQIDRARERSLSVLQKRYGYTREEAAYQLNKYYSKAWLG